MYVLVEFPEKNAVSAMPENWLINEEQCYWPLKDATKCIKEQVPKNERWRICSPIRLFRHANGEPRRYASYDVAHRKATELLELSDLSSTESEDVTDSRTRQKRARIPSPPKPSFFCINPIQSLLTVDNNVPYSSPTSNSNEHQPPLQNDSSVSPLAGFGADRPQTPNQGNDFLYRPNLPNGCNSAELLDAIKNLTTTVLNMETKINNLENYIYNMELRRNAPEAETENSVLPKLPLTKVEEIVALEHFLDSPGNARVLMSHLCCVGGDTVEKTTKFALMKLFSDEGARLVIWTGANGKLELQKMKILRVIYSATKKLHPSATEANVLGYIKIWIRRAGDRIRSKNKTKTPNQ